MFDADGSYPAQSGGGDIRFTSDAAGSTLLYAEIVSFVTDNDPANGSAEIWVKVTSVTASGDTTIYVWYNTSGSDSQPAVGAAGGRNGVWSGELLRWHLEDATTSTVTDSAGNFDGSKVSANNPVEVAAYHGNGQSFDSGDYIVTTNSSTLNRSGTQPFTIGGWLNLDNTDVANYLVGIVSGINSGTVDKRLLVGKNTANKLAAQCFDGSSEYAEWSTTPSTGTWYHVMGRYDGVDLDLFVNGSSVATNSTLTGSFDHGTNARLQMNYTASAGSQGGEYDADEIRYSANGYSDVWIDSEYKNQSAVGTYITAGTPAAAATFRGLTLLGVGS